MGEPGRERVHTIHGNGDETVTSTATHECSGYDAGDNTLTTLTSARGESTQAQPGTPPPLPTTIVTT